jgi:hypothetical protein
VVFEGAILNDGGLSSIGRLDSLLLNVNECWEGALDEVEGNNPITIHQQATRATPATMKNLNILTLSSLH